MEESKKPLFKVESSKFIALYFTGHHLECPHCGKPIEFSYTVGTVEFKKPEGRR